MPEIRFENEAPIEVPPSGSGSPALTVLSALERGGLELPFGCRSGACHKCLLRSRSKSARLDPNGQVGLSPFEVAAGHFLSCSTPCTSDLTCARVGLPEPLHASTIRTITKTDTRFRIDVDPWSDDFAVPGRQALVEIAAAPARSSRYPATIGAQGALWLPGRADLEHVEPGRPVKISDATGLALVPSEAELPLQHAFIVFDGASTATAAILARVLHDRLIRKGSERNSLRVITAAIPEKDVELSLFDRVPIEFAPVDIGESFARVLEEYSPPDLENAGVWALGPAETVLPLRGVAFRAGIPIRNGTRATDRDPVPPV